MTNNTIKPKWEKKYKLFFLIISLVFIILSINIAIHNTKIGPIESIVGLIPIILGLIATKAKLKINAWHTFIIYIILIFLSSLLFFILIIETLKPFIKNHNQNANRSDAYRNSSTFTNTFTPKKFIFEKDLFFKDLEYYIDGTKIPEEDRISKLTKFIKEYLYNNGPPERYKDDKDENLNYGKFADSTHKANEYYQSYTAIQAYDIDTSDKLPIIRKAKELRKDANEEAVTLKNTQNYIWDCEALRTELFSYINSNSDENLKKK